ncbi:hypothetical protein BX616_001988 [Lobosporangium transversale]|nr:hypothetical protein BX616_001988 [Lobosporangium transversale]
MAENNVPAASLRFLLLGDVGVGKSTFISTLASTLSAVHANDLIEEYIPAPLSSSTPAPSAIRLNGVHIGAGSVLQDDGSSPFDDPLGLLPPKVEVPSRDLTFLSLPGYSSTTNPSTILSLTDDYLNHHLHSVTSIFSPSIPSAQLAWFLIAGSGAHSLPTCAFYFVLYELKPIDIIYMKMIHERINLIPIIAKADTVSKNELWVLKKRMLRQLKMNGIKIHTFGLDMETIEKMTQQRQWGAPPFVVSTREDSEGQLLESELKLLIDLCLYKRIRHLQEDAARKVIAWKRTIEQTGRQTKTNVEKVWERGVANTKDTKTNHANGFTTNTTPVAAVATVNASTFVNNHSNGSYFTQADMLPSVSSPVNQIIPGQYAPPPSVQQQQQQVLTPPTPAPQINGQLASPINLPFTPPPSGNSSSLDKTDVSTNFGLSLTGYAPPPSFNNGATTGYSAPPSSFNKPASLGAVSSAYPVPGTAAVIPPPPSSSHAHPSQYTATTIYSPLPKTTSANSVVNAITPPIQSRLPLGHTVTGLSVDNSTRPTELTGENVQETVPDARRSFMESYTPKATGAADGVHSSPTLEAASSASAGAEE